MEIVKTIILSETIMAIMYQIESCKGLAKSCVGVFCNWSAKIEGKENKPYHENVML